MIQFPIVDTHVHLWDTNRLHYPWLAEIPQLNKPYLLEDYNRATGPVQVEKMVFLQCEVDTTQFMQEAEWVTQLAEEQDARIQGIVPWAPLETGDAARADLEKLSDNPLIKGVRRIIQFEPDIEFCLRPAFVKGVQALSDYNLSFDICIAHHHMANTIKMVAQCPDVRFILDHIGKPNIKDQIFEPWKTELKQLSEFPNVWCKISGLVTEADHQKWTREDLTLYIEQVIACFGFDRVIYGGDWPVATQATKYPRWVKTLAQVVQDCSESERRKLFHDNAIAFYQLPRAS